MSTEPNSDADNANEIERSLLALLPIESESLAATINFTLGSFEISDSEAAQPIISRLESIKLRAIENGVQAWVLKAGSLSGVEYEIAHNLYDYIINRANQVSFESVEDSYSGWAFFLLDWLQQLPAHVTWDLLKLYIKAWHYYWGGDSKDPNLEKLFEQEGYPAAETPEVKEHVEHLWENMRITVRAWLNDETLLRIGELLTRRNSTGANQHKRSSPGHHLPRTIMWTKGFMERLAQFGGLILALQNQWLENEPASIPDWLSNTSTLHTFPIGLRYGVKDPFSAAWYRHVVQERRAANLLQSLAPLQVEAILDLQDAWSDTRTSLSSFLQSGINGEEEIVLALKRLLSNA